MATTAAAPDHPSAFDAFGHPVPEPRRHAAYEALREMVPDSTAEQRFETVARMSDAIERDQPYLALKAVSAAPFHRGELAPRPERAPALALDVTGAYRMLATLCAG